MDTAIMNTSTTSTSTSTSSCTRGYSGTTKGGISAFFLKRPSLVKTSHSDKRFVLATESESSVFPSTSKERAAVTGLDWRWRRISAATPRRHKKIELHQACCARHRAHDARFAPFLVKYATVYPGTYFRTYFQNFRTPAPSYERSRQKLDFHPDGQHCERHSWPRAWVCPL